MNSLRALPWFVVTVMVLGGLSSGHGADARRPLPSKLQSNAACAALTSAAETNHIPMTQMDTSLETNALHPGDSATVLGTLVLKKNQTQWLLYIQAAQPDSNHPPKPEKPMVVNLFHDPISFESKPVPATLRMLGPFPVSGSSRDIKPEARSAQFSLNESFLGLGLDRAAAVIWEEHQGSNTAGGTNAIAKLTPEQKRALSGAVPALMSYFEIARHTEGLEGLLIKLIKLPSPWSVIRHAGVTADLYFGAEAFPANPLDWNLPASAAVFYLPCMVQLNKQPALKITFVVTTPHPPLLICAGVIGVLAERPGDDDMYMTLRIISAKRQRHAEGDSHASH